MDIENVIVINGLNKNFGEITAVDNLSFSVKKGELFAFLGINGAGKSTTISIICSQLKADSGTVEILGKPLSSASVSKLGVVFQNSVLDLALSVKDNLEARAALYGIKGEEFKQRLSLLAETLDFAPIINRSLGKLSGGQRRRIDIARALIHKPDILILDEPTTGLDPQTRKLLWNVINNLRKRDNMTVFLTTHYMEEAAEADYVVIIDAGKIVAKGTPLELKNKYTGDFITLYNTQEEAVKGLNLPYKIIRDAFVLEVENTAKATELILNCPELFKDYEITKGKMDDVFLAVTGKKLSGGEDK